MTPEEKKQFHEGADKPGDDITEARMFQRIPEDPIGRKVHELNVAAAKLREEKQKAGDAVRAAIIVEQIKGETGPSGTDKLEETAIVAQPQSKKGLWKKLFG